MKTKQIKLSVPEPCHEDWNKMTPKDQGAFCQSCAKVVVDFTKMSDRDIIAYLEKNKAEKTCGKFNSYQLDRKISAAIPSPNYLIQFKKFFTGLFFGLSFPSFIQANTISTKKNSSYVSDNADIVEKITIKGQVRDQQGVAIQNAQIRIYQNGRITNQYTSTNRDGNFELTVAKSSLDRNLSLKISSDSYEDESIPVVDDSQLTISLYYNSPKNEQMLGQVAIFDPAPVLQCGFSEIENISISGELEVQNIGDVDIQTQETAIVPNKILGKVINQSGEPIPFVIVRIPNINQNVYTDIDGYFQLVLTKEELKNPNLQIQVDMFLYESVVVPLSSLNLENLEIVLLENKGPMEFQTMGIVSLPVIEDGPNSFNNNYQEPEWKQKGFGSLKEYWHYLKQNP